MIKQILKRYHTDHCVFHTEPHDLKNGFLLRLRLKALPTAENGEVLYEIPGTLRITAAHLSWEESCGGWGWNENYSSYPDETGHVPVLEAAIYLDVPYHPERTELKIGIPLTMYDVVNTDLILMYDGMHLYFLHDGIVINENFPTGTLKPASGTAFKGGNLALAEFSSDLDALETTTFERTLNRSIHAYSPAGHSAWAGDVVNFWHDGVYHLFFLYDQDRPRTGI